MLKILFLCTGNSCRSQMAEGWTRHLKGDVIEPYSAGIEAHGLNPNAVTVMAEAGVDISGQRSKRVDQLRPVEFDYVVTVCSEAEGRCPVFPGKAKRSTSASTTRRPWRSARRPKQRRLAPYRRVRDEIKAFVETLPGALADLTAR